MGHKALIFRLFGRKFRVRTLTGFRLFEVEDLCGTCPSRLG